MGPDDLFNPFKYLAGEAGKVIADGWTSAMLGLWNAGLWALRLVLNIIDALLTPDLGENGPGGVVFATRTSGGKRASTRGRCSPS